MLVVTVVTVSCNNFEFTVEHVLKTHYQHRLVCSGFNLVDNDAIEAMA